MVFLSSRHKPLIFLFGFIKFVCHTNPDIGWDYSNEHISTQRGGDAKPKWTQIYSFSLHQNIIWHRKFVYNSLNRISNTYSTLHCSHWRSFIMGLPVVGRRLSVLCLYCIYTHKRARMTFCSSPNDLQTQCRCKCLESNTRGTPPAPPAHTNSIITFKALLFERFWLVLANPMDIWKGNDFVLIYPLRIWVNI